jgi:hypothetical protein
MRSLFSKGTFARIESRIEPRIGRGIKGFAKGVKGEDGFLPFLGFIALASPAVCTVGGVIYKVLTSPTALSTLDFIVTKLYHWFFK